MKYGWFVLVVIGTNALADSDEVLVEQLMQRHGTTAAKAPVARLPKSDPALALVGQAVRVRTVDRGLYLGILTGVDAAAIHLDIATGGQKLAYALPRSAIAQLEPAAAR